MTAPAAPKVTILRDVGGYGYPVRLRYTDVRRAIAEVRRYAAVEARYQHALALRRVRFYLLAAVEAATRNLPYAPNPAHMRAPNCRCVLITWADEPAHRRQP